MRNIGEEYVSRIMSIDRLRNAWNMDTCFPGERDRWSIKRPEIGQCSITALLAQTIFGGIIVKDHKYYHYFNLINGEEVDLTRAQFDGEDDVCVYSVADENILLEHKDTASRYELLLKRLLS